MSRRAGVAYFGSRIVRHVAADMAALAERGFTGVLHTFTENDLAYYRETMREIVRLLARGRSGGPDRPVGRLPDVRR